MSGVWTEIATPRRPREVDQAKAAPGGSQVPVRLPFDKSARKDLVSDATNSATARTRGVSWMSLVSR